MSRKIQLPSLVFLVSCVLWCAACGGNPYPSTGDANNANQSVASTDIPVPTTIPLPTGSAGEPLVATVNGEPITLESFRQMVAQFQADPSLRADPDGLRAAVMRTLIEEVLIEQAAGQEQITVTDAEVDAELGRYVEAVGGQDQWASWLAQNLYTADQFRTSLHTTLLTNKVRDHVTAGLDQPVAQVHARHILVGTREEATSILAQLHNGQDFAALAAAFSLDTTTRLTGGDLGWFTQDELLEPELANIAFELQPNQIAGPIETALGYHIIQTLEADVRPVAEEKRAMLAQTQFEQWLATLEANAAIEQYL